MKSLSRYQYTLLKRLMITAPLLMALSSCSTLPQKMKFPTPPELLMQRPEKMELIQTKSDGPIDSDSTLKLSELTQAIVENYNKYHLLEQQLKSLQEWITEQEKIHNAE